MHEGKFDPLISWMEHNGFNLISIAVIEHPCASLIVLIHTNECTVEEIFPSRSGLNFDLFPEICNILIQKFDVYKENR